MNTSDLIPYISKIKTKNGKELTVGDISKEAGPQGIEYHIELMDGSSAICTLIYDSKCKILQRVKEHLGDYISDWDIVDTGTWVRFIKFHDIPTIKQGCQLLLQSGQVITLDRYERHTWSKHIIVSPKDPTWSIMAYDEHGRSVSTSNHNIIGYSQ